jgi:hypothetical protein
MDEVRVLERKIDERVFRADQARQVWLKTQRQLRADYRQRCMTFQGLAARFLRLHVRPRVQALAARFGNARPVPAEDAGRFCCAYLFTPTPAVPATARLAVAVYPDQAAEQVVLFQSVEAWPALFSDNGRELLVQPLDGFDEAEAAAWVEERLLQFTDAYLGHEVGPLRMATAAA